MPDDRPLEEALSNVSSLVAASMADSVASVVRRRIVDGQLSGGVRLTEATVSELLGVSRNTVREAWIMLASEGLCVRVPNRGVFVTTPTPALVRDLYAGRAVIETGAVAWGDAFGPDAVARVRTAVADGQRHRDARDWSAVASANQEFHGAIVALSGSERVVRVFESMLALMRLVFHAIGDDAFHAPWVDGNDRVATLLEAGRRVDAAEALRDYLRDASEQVGALVASPTTP